MPLVDYSSSEDEDDGALQPEASTSSSAQNVAAGQKRKHSPAPASAPRRPPPLPEAFHDIYASKPRVGVHDDPSLHGGRKRAVPHQPGNWPSHVYLEWRPSPEETAALEDVVRAARANADPDIEIESLMSDDAGAPRPLHISLSVALTLRTENKDEFLQSVKDAMRVQSPRASSEKTPNELRVKCHDLLWAPNHWRTRWFFVLRLAKAPGDRLNGLTKMCNEVAKKFDLPLLPVGSNPTTGSKQPGDNDAVLDQTDRFHFSIAWAVKAPSKSHTGVTPFELDAEKLGQLQKIQPAFSCLKVKIGNVVTTIPLHDQEGDSRGNLG